MEKVRLFLRLRERLKKSSEQKRLTEGDKTTGVYLTPVSPSEPKRPIPDKCDIADKDRGVVERVLRLIKLRIPVNKEPPTGKVGILYNIVVGLGHVL